MGLGSRSSTCCEVGHREVSGQSDGEGRGRRGEAARPTAGKTNKKNKQTVGLRRDPARRDPLRDLPLPSSFFFLFSFFFNQLLHGLNFFCAFFSLYVRCQLVSGEQNTQPFCHNRIEVILLVETYMRATTIQSWQKRRIFCPSIIS